MVMQHESLYAEAKYFCSQAIFCHESILCLEKTGSFVVHSIKTAFRRLGGNYKVYVFPAHWRTVANRLSGLCPFFAESEPKKTWTLPRLVGYKPIVAIVVNGRLRG
jgi:hypothetical protein